MNREELNFCRIACSVPLPKRTSSLGFLSRNRGEILFDLFQKGWNSISFPIFNLANAERKFIKRWLSPNILAECALSNLYDETNDS